MILAVYKEVLKPYLGPQVSPIMGQQFLYPQDPYLILTSYIKHLNLDPKDCYGFVKEDQFIIIYYKDTEHYKLHRASAFIGMSEEKMGKKQYLKWLVQQQASPQWAHWSGMQERVYLLDDDSSKSAHACE